jgi:transposase
VTAPEPVRGSLRKLTSKQRIRACAVMRPGPVSDPASAVKTALRALARHWQALQAEIDDLDMQLTPLVTFVASELLALAGVLREAKHAVDRLKPGPDRSGTPSA